LRRKRHWKVLARQSTRRNSAVYEEVMLTNEGRRWLSSTPFWNVSLLQTEGRATYFSKWLLSTSSALAQGQLWNENYSPWLEGTTLFSLHVFGKQSLAPILSSLFNL
jgi:hypothetical protein